MSRNRLYVFLLSVVLLLPITNYAAEQDFKNTLIDEVDVSGTGYYGRLLVVGDDNDDGIKESIYLKLSPKYMEYVWKPGWEARRRDTAYHNKGIKLSKSPDWLASLLSASLQQNNAVGARWDAKFNGDAGCVHPPQFY